MLAIRNCQLWLYSKPTDMRKSFNGLVALIRNQLQQDPVNGHLFIFVNRRKTLLKALYWEKDGYCIWHKRLEMGQFNLSGDDRQITQTEFQALLEGIKIKTLRRYKR